MVYRRRSARRRFRRPFRKGGRKHRRSFRKRARALVAAAAEKKYFLSSFTDFAALNNVWHEYLFGIMSQGVANGQRIGNRVEISSVNIRLTLESGNTGGVFDDSHETLRIVMAVWDRKDKDTTVSTQLEEGTRRGFSDPITRTDMPGLKRKLLDKFIHMVPQGTNMGDTGYTAVLKEFKYQKKFKKPIVITFKDNTALRPDQVLALSMLSDSAVVPHPGAISGWVSWRYTDS
ncbi:putative capsid [uncultured virus]|uniref:Putative capsid n=1 Tax=uncultured virus TaxID=340016 RepID=A0A2K9LSH7_9VIRU|nr:putative capsid [uncultured virus]